MSYTYGYPRLEFWSQDGSARVLASSQTDAGNVVHTAREPLLRLSKYGPYAP